MLQNNASALSGENNRRLNVKMTFDQGLNAPLSEADQMMPNSNVTIPSEENVLQAKDWVDNGSQT
ncbi:MAG: CDIF630_02480 family spore surface protein [Peptostreptococcaceae bacterium]